MDFEWRALRLALLEATVGQDRKNRNSLEVVTCVVTVSDFLSTECLQVGCLDRKLKVARG